LSAFIKLMEISKESVAVAEQTIPLIICMSDSLVCRLIPLCSEIVFSTDVSINQSFQSNFEFLDTIRTFLLACKEQNYRITEVEVDVLLCKIDSLLKELTAIPIGKRVADDFLHGDKTNGDFTEPSKSVYEVYIKICCCCSGREYGS